jgi:ABC-type lipoprotein export system ATPase subunit
MIMGEPPFDPRQPTTMNAVTLDRVTKTFGQYTAVADLSLQVPPGTVYGFIGPNGSGKTTTLRMIMRILHPNSGDICVLGERSLGAANDRVGYLPEERGLYKQMKVRDLLRFYAALKGMRDSRAAVASWLERLGLSEWADKKVQALSKGMSQKVQFIATVIARPELVLLDEPCDGTGWRDRFSPPQGGCAPSFPPAPPGQAILTARFLLPRAGERGRSPSASGARAPEVAPLAARRPAGAPRQPDSVRPLETCGKAARRRNDSRRALCGRSAPDLPGPLPQRPPRRGLRRRCQLCGLSRGGHAILPPAPHERVPRPREGVPRPAAGVGPPYSPLATGLSFFPFSTPMLMIVRQSVPPGLPMWQPLVGMVLVLATTVLCVYAAGRIFRVGLLVQGKGARLGEMVQWVFRG